MVDSAAVLEDPGAGRGDEAVSPPDAFGDCAGCGVAVFVGEGVEFGEG